jgi:hypothetical protein
LACQGTTTYEKLMETQPKPASIAMGITVDFTAGTVHGFGDPVPVTDVQETTVVFSDTDPADAHMLPPGAGSESKQPPDDDASEPQIPLFSKKSVFGSIDRVTGDVWAIIHWTDTWGIAETNYSLKCKPTQRLF